STCRARRSGSGGSCTVRNSRRPRRGRPRRGRGRLADPAGPSGPVRRFSATRKVRLADADRSGRLRLDALARYLQDVANDDAVDGGLEGAMAWVVRRVDVDFDPAALPRLGDVIELATWCGGTGSRWAERRTALPGAEAAAVWVCIDPVSGRPAPLNARFHELYDSAAAGRTVSARLHQPGPPEGAARRPWPLRTTDFDALGHVNNTIAFAAVEDALDVDSLRSVAVEYRAPILPGDDVQFVVDDNRLWLT